MCSRVAGGDEPPSVLSDNLHNLILRIERPGRFQAGLFAVSVSSTDTRGLRVANELDVRLGWSPVVSSSLLRRWSRCHRTVTRYPHRGHVTGTGQCFRGPTKNIPARVGPCPPERPPVEARQTRICRASSLSSSPDMPFDHSGQTGQAGRMFRALDLQAVPPVHGAVGGAGHASSTSARGG